jgi:hypothetical protein
MVREKNEADQDLDRLLDDLEYIKKAVSKRNNIFNFMEVAKAIRLAALLSGLLIIFISTVLYLLIRQYGSYHLMPGQTRLYLYLYIALAIIFIAVLKLRSFLRKAREIDSTITLRDLVAAIYTSHFIEIMIPFLIVLVGVPLYLSTASLDRLILPFTAIVFGLLCFAISGLLYFRSLLFLGGWLLLAGFTFLFWLPGLHELFQVIISFGLGFLVMGAAGYIRSSREE